MSDPAVKVVAEILREHPYVMGNNRCFCGVQCWADTHREHVAELVVAALPQPDTDTVAEAIRRADQICPEECPTWLSTNEDERNDYRALARAAIDAGRQP